MDRQPDPRAAAATLDAEKNRAALIIDPGFEADLRSGRGARVQLILDGSDNAAAGTILGYLAGAQAIASRRLLDPPPPKPPVFLQTRYLFNPELNTPWFIVPGLTVIIIAILSILLTSLTVAREWENGSMELLLSTPVEPSEIIIGKLLPYTAMGPGGIALIYVAAGPVFGVPFRGSHHRSLRGHPLGPGRCRPGRARRGAHTIRAAWGGAAPAPLELHERRTRPRYRALPSS